MLARFGKSSQSVWRNLNLKDIFRERRKLWTNILFGAAIILLMVITTTAYTTYVRPLILTLGQNIEDTSEDRENVSWNIHQLKGAIHKLQYTALEEYHNPPSYSKLRVRYEIVLSRISLLSQGKSYQQLNTALKSTEDLWSLRDALHTLEPLILEVESGNRESLSTIIEQTGNILDETSSFALKVNQLYHQYVGTRREDAQRNLSESRRTLAVISAILGGAFIALSIVLYFTINSRREAEEQRILAQKSSHAKARFLASMSHEIRTPLNAMIGFAKLASNMQQAESTEKVREYMRDVRGAGEQLSALINGILDWSKIESEKLELDEHPVQIRKHLRSFADVYAAKANHAERCLTLDLGDSLPEYTILDSTRLNQILTNLLGNALKFTDKGKRITLRAHSRSMNLELSIEDEGIGIPKDKLSTIFNAFEQAEYDTTRRFGGTGLGLSISKELARLMGGDITVQSTVGIGSKFNVSLPIKEASQADIEKITPSRPADDTLNLDPENVILLVEDGLLNQKLIRIIFQRLGLQIHVANDGEEGVQKAIELCPDLILMDMQMPKMDGMEATREIRETAGIAETPIVFLTANAFTEDRRAAMEAGVDAFLTKPLQLEELQAELVRYLKPRPAEVSQGR